MLKSIEGDQQTRSRRVGRMTFGKKMTLLESVGPNGVA